MREFMLTSILSLTEEKIFGNNYEGIRSQKSIKELAFIIKVNVDFLQSSKEIRKIYCSLLP